MSATTIAIVDDSSSVRHLLRLVLELEDRFDVIGEGASGDDAIALAAEHRPDVMVIDLSMPVKDGLEALPEILAVSPESKVIVLSGFEARGMAPAALKLGAIAYVEKDIDLSRFAERVVEILDGDPSMTHVLVGAGHSPLGPMGSTAVDAAASEILRDQRERVDIAFERAVVGMATLTLSRSVVRANEALCDLLRGSESELVGIQFERLGHPDDADAAALRLDEAAGGVDEVEFDVRLGPNRDGAWTPVRGVAESVRGLDGQAQYLLVQVTDVAELRRAQDEIVRLRATLEDVLSRVPEAVRPTRSTGAA